MDINSTFIFSDYNLNDHFYPWNEPYQVEQNLKYHVLSPDENKVFSPRFYRTACLIHTSIARNLLLYSYNPSSSKLVKKIAARFLAFPVLAVEILPFVFFTSTLITFSLNFCIKLGYDLIKAPTGQKTKLWLQGMLDNSRDPLFSACGSSIHGVTLPLEFLFGGSGVLNMAMPGYKVINKKTQQEEYILDLNKLDYLKKYCGWEDASEKQVHDLLQRQLKTTPPILEYFLDEKQNLQWDFVLLTKPIFGNPHLHTYINAMIIKNLIRPNF